MSPPTGTAVANPATTATRARRGRLVIVSGAPGAGKTTLAHVIARELRYPLFCKDELKEALGDELGAPADVPASQRLGRAAYRILFLIAAATRDAGTDAVIESNFRRGRSERELGAAIAGAAARLIHYAADPETTRARYDARFRSGERHPVHLDAERSVGLTDDLATGRFEPLGLDIPSLIVRTDDGYDPELGAILAFASGGRP